MYRVLLADDEQSILEFMQQYIPWQEHGLEVAYTAVNGKQAYDILVSKTPDIAILDIRMPGYTGLELCRMIRQMGLKTQVIIVSGYAEFSYAQKAIQYGVIGYCLKPVEYDELNAMLLKATHNLQNVSHSIISDDFLDALENNDLDNILRYLRKIQYLKEVYYLAASVSDSPLPLANALAFRIGPSQYGYLSDAPFSDMKRFFEQSHVAGIGIYPAPVTPDKLRAAFYRCVAMAYQYFIEPSARICSQYHEFHSLPLTTQLQNAISFSEKDRLEQLLRQLMSEGHYRLFSIYSAQQLYNMIISNQKLVENPQDYYIYSYQQLVHEYDSFQNMIENLIQLISTSTELSSEQSDLSNTYFLKIIKYINTYYNENITLKDVAKVVNLNPNYISQVFKKTAGTTFSHYLTNLRITQAKKLLTTTNASINEISLQSGFNDYFYFLKTFKKYTGKTPSEYRNLSGE